MVPARGTRASRGEIATEKTTLSPTFNVHQSQTSTATVLPSIRAIVTVPISVIARLRVQANSTAVVRKKEIAMLREV